MDLLENVVQPYAWGSRTALAALRGLPTPSPTPEAELWMGAHPGAPSVSVRAGPADERLTLAERIARAPEAELGPRVVSSLGAELPFLLKILAAEQPLSLQAHPSLAQARLGFDAEEAAGLPRSAPHRNYKDRNHKPELLCALTPFDALCGFRAVEDTLAMFAELGTLDALSRRLAGERGVREAFAWLMSLQPRECQALTEATLAACARPGSSRFAGERAWAVRLGQAYPGDVGVLGAMLLNLVHLEPGEAIYLPAGNLHAYLRGVGVEIMASSDNVLRGGLTPKHVDVPELLEVLEFRAGPVAKVLPEREGAPEACVYERWRTPAREFALSRVTLTGGAWSSRPLDAPIVAICTDGAVLARDAGLSSSELSLDHGRAVFVPASSERLELSGTGTVYLATVP